MHQVPKQLDVSNAADADRFTIESDDSHRFSVGVGAAQPLLTIPAITDHYLLMIHGEGGKELVRIKPDGTVVAAYPGAEEPAARAFWQALQSYGTSIVARLRDLETRLAKHEAVEPFAL